jgi:hypothetical protein
MTDPDGWRSQLMAGRLEVVLDTTNSTEVFTFIQAVSQTLHDLRFREATSLRVRRILRELLDNVAAHVRDKRALVTVGVTERFLRNVSVDVADRGRGLPSNVVSQYVERLGGGEREHGLVLATRLASVRRENPNSTADFPNGIGFEVMEFERPPLPTTRDDVGCLCLEYRSPEVFWIGKDTSQVDFGDVASARCLVVELTGHDVASSVVGSATLQDALRAALELHFQPHFASRNVLFLAHDTVPRLRDGLHGWAAEWKCPSVSSVNEVRALLALR